MIVLNKGLINYYTHNFKYIRQYKYHLFINIKICCNMLELHII